MTKPPILQVGSYPGWDRMPHGTAAPARDIVNGQPKPRPRFPALSSAWLPLAACLAVRSLPNPVL